MDRTASECSMADSVISCAEHLGSAIRDSGGFYVIATQIMLVLVLSSPALAHGGCHPEGLVPVLVNVWLTSFDAVCALSKIYQYVAAADILCPVSPTAASPSRRDGGIC